MVAPIQAMLNLCHQQSTGRHETQGRTPLMIEAGLGFWITPDSEAVPTPPRISHADLMRRMIEPTDLSDDDREQFLIDVNAFAISRGWTRVRIYPTEKTVYADLGQGKRRQHMSRLNTLLDEIGLPGLTLKYTDEDGNYITP